MKGPDKEFSEKAVKYWTSERLEKLTGGKKFILTPKNAPVLLRYMGLLNGDASFSRDQMRKWIQVNHFLQLLAPHLKEITKNRQKITVFEGGTGKGYISLALAFFLTNQLNTDFEILAVDRVKAPLDKARSVAESLFPEQKIEFLQEHLTEGSDKKFDLVLSLHACDQATDYVMAQALLGRSECFVVAPCCQAELASYWRGLKGSDLREFKLSPLLQNPTLRRSFGSLMTDSIRMELARACGYEVTLQEFVDQEHSGKNLLLIARKRGHYHAESYQTFLDLKQAGAAPILKLESLLSNYVEAFLKQSQT